MEPTADTFPRQAVSPDFPDFIDGYDRMRPLQSRQSLALPIGRAVDGFEIGAIEDALEDLARYAMRAREAAKRSDLAEVDAMMHQVRLAMLAAVQEQVKLPEATPW